MSSSFAMASAVPGAPPHTLPRPQSSSRPIQARPRILGGRGGVLGLGQPSTRPLAGTRGVRIAHLSAKACRRTPPEEAGPWGTKGGLPASAPCASADVVGGGRGRGRREEGGSSEARDRSIAVALGIATALALGVPEHAWAEAIDPFFSFNPVCPAADGVFRAGQRTALAIAGDKNIENYRPLINDVLIRVRTELCVLESFSRETAVPFIKEKGLGWVLPIHETSETYLAGVVFMVGTNFILLGSTKVVAILSIYHDLALGLPARLLGKVLGFADSNPSEKAAKELDALMEKQMAEVREVMKGAKDPSDVSERLAEVNTQYQGRIEALKSNQVAAEASRRDAPVGKALSVASAAAVPFRIYGQGSQIARNVLEVFDTFCSRYFVTFTVAYIIVKTVHFVVFPDFP